MGRLFFLMAAIGLLPWVPSALAAGSCSEQVPPADSLPPVPVTCMLAKAGVARAGQLATDSLFVTALKEIRNAFNTRPKEYVIALGRDTAGKLLVSRLTHGTALGGRVPGIAHAFADLHNHTNDAAPDAGDFYGLADLNKNNHTYDTRFVLTAAGVLYALFVTDPAAAALFNVQHPRQPPAFKGGPPGFPERLVDEFRELKYRYGCTDEMAMAFLLEQYHAGMALLKQDSSGHFRILITKKTTAGNYMIYTADVCPR